MGATYNAVYFTREQFATGLCLPIPSFVKRFLHFTRAPPALVHPNAFRILMGCSVLNFLYQLDISLVEICFIYTLKLGGTCTPLGRLCFGIPFFYEILACFDMPFFSEIFVGR